MIFLLFWSPLTAALALSPMVTTAGRAPAPAAPRAAVRLVETPEFSRPFNARNFGKYARSDVCATPAECAALAQRFDLEAIGGLSANVSVSLVNRQSGRLRVYGSLDGSDISRKSSGGDVVTLQAQGVDFETFFVPEEKFEARPIDMDDDESFDEPLEDGQVDLGELVAQHLYMYLYDLSQSEVWEWAVEDEDSEILIEFDESGKPVQP